MVFMSSTCESARGSIPELPRRNSTITVAASRSVTLMKSHFAFLARLLKIEYHNQINLFFQAVQISAQNFAIILFPDLAVRCV